MNSTGCFHHFSLSSPYTILLSPDPTNLFSVNLFKSWSDEKLKLKSSVIPYLHRNRE